LGGIHTNKRPTAITVVCIIGFVSFGLSLLAIPSLLGRMTSAYGAWYGPFWLVSVALTIVSLIGLWRMKKWGVYLYTALFALGTVVGLVAKLPFTVLGVVVPLVIIGLGFANIKQMN
jgi:hypothetical protein